MKLKRYIESVDFNEIHPSNPGVRYHTITKGVMRNEAGEWFDFIESKEHDNRLGWTGNHQTHKMQPMLDIAGFQRARTVVLAKLESSREYRRGAGLRALEAHEAEVKREQEKAAYYALATEMKNLGFSVNRNGSFKPVGQIKGRGVIISYQTGHDARWCLDCRGCRQPESFATATEAAAFVKANWGRFNIEINPTIEQ